MTMDMGAVPTFDQGNPFAHMELPAFMTAVEVELSNGEKRLMVTIRCATTTLTMLLPKSAAKDWAKMLGDEADKMSDLVTPPAAGKLIVPNGQHRPQ